MKNKFTDELIIKATQNTPLVQFYPNGNLQIKGNSFPDYGGSVFDPIFDWVSKYILNPAPKTEFYISIDIHNDISSKFILKIIMLLNDHCKNLKIIWEYEEGDEDNVFLATCLSESVKKDFVFKEKHTGKISEFKWGKDQEENNTIETEPTHHANNQPEKPVVSIKDYFDFLLERRHAIDRDLKTTVLAKKYFSGSERLLNIETKIFSMWLVSWILEDRRLKDMFHQRFCDEVGLDRDEIMLFYDQIKIRYDIYNDALGRFFDNPQSGHLIGTVMFEIIVNQNHDFSIEENLPLTDGDQSLEMFMLFDSYFHALLETIRKIKQKYVLPTLN